MKEILLPKRYALENKETENVVQDCAHIEEELRHRVPRLISYPTGVKWIPSFSANI